MCWILANGSCIGQWSPASNSLGFAASDTNTHLIFLIKITERVEMKVVTIVIFLVTAIEARGKRPKPKPKWVTIKPFCITPD